MSKEDSIQSDTERSASSERSTVQFGVWRPIESAPTDGTFVIIAGGEPGYNWGGDQSGFLPPAVVASFSAGGWQFAHYDSGHYGVYENPTIWTPLPPPRERLNVTSTYCAGDPEHSPSPPSIDDRDVDTESAGVSVNQTTEETE